MLTLQFVPYDELIGLDSNRKVQKLLKIIKQDKIVLMEGKLSSDEEAELIERTMEEIDRRFKGIEIASLEPGVSSNVADILRNSLYKILFGNSRGMTVMGPANIIKEIKKDPNKLQLYTSSTRGGRR